MTKRRRHKINKIMSSPFPYVEKGKFEYLFRQERLWRKHENYLSKMHSRSFKRLVKNCRSNTDIRNHYDR